MNIIEATADYETWLRKHLSVDDDGLALKHKKMAKSLFPFLRATFYRWIQRWPKSCPELADAPQVLAVGDLHVENFGTWRDTEGRLAWGVNDSDEAHRLAYTNDLVRLAASCILAIPHGALRVSRAKACQAILLGYRQWLAKAGRPFVLAEHYSWLRGLAREQLRDAPDFWAKLQGCPDSEDIPGAAATMLAQALPERVAAERMVVRTAGLGSLGHRRYVALAAWRGALVAREAKAICPSACVWAGMSAGKNQAKDLFKRAVRCPDSTMQMRDGWVVRRLSPDCKKIELESIPRRQSVLRLLRAMGRETANIHLATKNQTPKILADLKRRTKQNERWLQDAAEKMLANLAKDWHVWRKRHS